jgi:hypothetical protein
VVYSKRRVRKNYKPSPLGQTSPQNKSDVPRGKALLLFSRNSERGETKNLTLGVKLPLKTRAVRAMCHVEGGPVYFVAETSKEEKTVCLEQGHDLFISFPPTWLQEV